MQAPVSTFPEQEEQFHVLLRRAWLSTTRRRDVILAQLVKATLMGLGIGLIYREVFSNPGAVSQTVGRSSVKSGRQTGRQANLLGALNGPFVIFTSLIAV